VANGALFFSLLFAFPAEGKKSMWTDSLEKSLRRLEAKYPGQLGVYVKQLDTGADFSLRAEENWYLASGVKVPVAVALLRDVEKEKVSLDEKMTLGEDDLVDGTGTTNDRSPGTELSLRFLFEQMLILSDNTASDLLIEKVGLARVNRRLQRLVPGAFGEITTLADVRRHVYGHITPAAWSLRNRDLLRLKEMPVTKRTRGLASILKLPGEGLGTTSLDEAYEKYYASGLNSGSLLGYARLLEAIEAGKALGPAMTGLLLETLERVETGRRRIRAGLPKGTVFAHKTGTQYGRVCDFGLARHAEEENHRVLILACARDFPSTARAESALAAVGRAVSASGLLSRR
jgi:beta-lactamase class A